MNFCGRSYNQNTDTWAFADGSGLLTGEQVERLKDCADGQPGSLWAYVSLKNSMEKARLELREVA